MTEEKKLEKAYVPYMRAFLLYGVYSILGFIGIGSIAFFLEWDLPAYLPKWLSALIFLWQTAVHLLLPIELNLFPQPAKGLLSAYFVGLCLFLGIFILYLATRDIGNLMN